MKWLLNEKGIFVIRYTYSYGPVIRFATLEVVESEVSLVHLTMQPLVGRVVQHILLPFSDSPQKFVVFSAIFWLFYVRMRLGARWTWKYNRKRARCPFIGCSICKRSGLSLLLWCITQTSHQFLFLSIHIRLFSFHKKQIISNCNKLLAHAIFAQPNVILHV